jgi:outer membrane protein
LRAARQQTAAAEAAWKGVEREQGLGLRSTIDVLDAEREWQEARIAQTRAEADAVFAAHALIAATRALSLETLAPEAPPP